MILHATHRRDTRYPGRWVADSHWGGGRYKSLLWALERMTCKAMHPGDACIIPAILEYIASAVASIWTAIGGVFFGVCDMFDVGGRVYEDEG